MSTATKIEWTDATWNPVTGCTEVSAGCDRCYAKTFAERFRGVESHYFEQGFDVTLRPEKLTLPFQWKRPRKVFVNSMSDLFHKDVPDEYIAAVFAVMAATPHHTYQILTKRHGRMRSFLRDECRCGAKHPAGAHLLSAMDWAATPHNPDYVPGLSNEAVREGTVGYTFGRPLKNVWIGVSAEDQYSADLRIPALLETPAAVRFVSAEPLLTPLNLWKYLVPNAAACWTPGHVPDRADKRALSIITRAAAARHGGRYVDWVIAGGESGHGARPMHPNWVRSLRDQCDLAAVPFLFKQWGEWGPAPWRVERAEDEPVDIYKNRAESTGATHAYAAWSYQYGHEVNTPSHKPWSAERTSLGEQHAAIRRWGKKHSGRELDGRTWDEYPERVA